ncbi:XRE family transcriptional regulator [Pseudomonas fuscovaginae UPB0736]|uniref:XRE family transcriptional regulator n=1 Tax=Pseudomonas asplenii TaxID=53407 RepID=UPI0002FA0CAB|nr:XRE family transcriptional regulator [Pseudomonas fuscovaginae]UUQ67770.1 XRE family transcriptional regulator [Pseudomonas fuscovaginae UPB0736]
MAVTLWDKVTLDTVFGKDSTGDNVEERARTSNREFVRSQVQIAFANERATGRKLSAREALDNFGSNILLGLSHKNAVPLILKAGEPGKTIKSRRTEMSLSVGDLARATNIEVERLISFETGDSILPFRDIERISRSLVLDESVIGYQPGSGGDPQLGVRFKEFFKGADDGAGPLSSALVLRLSESAWVVKKQLSLQTKLGVSQTDVIRNFGIKPDNDYKYPAYKKGYTLAAQTRKLLEIGETEPIMSLSNLVENKLSIPVVQSDFSSKFAGATVSPSDTGRGIVLNTNGSNLNVWVRRTTLAHELGHLLWDPDHRLNKLVVDEYDDFNRSTDANDSIYDEVEARANAFAAEFLAPAEGVREVFNSYHRGEDGLRAVMEHFGVGFITAKWQLINTRLIAADEKFSSVDHTHTDDWAISEEACLSYSPVPSIPESRRGHFAKIVFDCVQKRIISNDSAAFCLSISENEFLKHRETLASLH